MWRDQTPEWRVAALFALGLVVWSVVMGVSARLTFHHRPDDPLAPVLALEMADDVEEVHAILLAGEDACRNVSALKLHLGLDLVFMALYGPLLVALGVLAGTPNRWWRRALVGLAVATVLFDVAENLGLWEIATTITWQAATRTVHTRALVKWALFFATVAYVTLLWWRSSVPSPTTRVALAVSGGGVVLLGLIGLWWPRAIAWSFAPMAVFLPVAVLGSRRAAPAPDPHESS